MTTMRRWAQLTGLAYLVLFVSGLVGFFLIRRQLYVPDDAMRTAANLVAHEGLARLGIAVDLVTVLAQALAAVGFFLVFRRVDSVGAASITAFGLVNCVVVLMAIVFSATALQVALRGGPTSASEALTLYDLNAATWNTAGLFMFMWLIPMGWLTLRSGSMSSRSRSAMAFSSVARASLRCRIARALLMASQIPTQQNNDSSSGKRLVPGRPPARCAIEGIALHLIARNSRTHQRAS